MASARRLGSPERPRGDAPLVSVLLPAWEEEALLGRCLDALLRISEPSLEVVVCAGGTDGTLEVAQRYAGPRVIVLEQRDGEAKQGALRRCLGASRGEIIYLTDADTVVPADVLQALVEPVLRGDAAATTGPSRPLPEQCANPFALFCWSLDYQWRVLWRARRRRTLQEGRPFTTRWLLGRNAAVGRDALLDAGGFAEPAQIGTDVHLARALLHYGHAIQYVRAAVETDFLTSPREYVRQQSRWFRAPLLHARRFGADRDVVLIGLHMLLSLVVVAWPLTLPRTRRRGLISWLAVIAALTWWRAACARELVAEQHVDVPDGYYARLPVFTLLEVAARAWTVVDLTLRDVGWGP